MSARSRRTAGRALRFAILIAGTFADAARAQHRQLLVELSPVHATIGFGWGDAERLMGLDLGAGIPVWDITIAPIGADMVEIAHVGFFVRSRPTTRAAFDVRLNAGLGGERISCSGCLPAEGGSFVALGGGAFFGGRHVKAGARLRTGLATEWGESSRFFINLTPLILLFTWDWIDRPF